MLASFLAWLNVCLICSGLSLLAPYPTYTKPSLTPYQRPATTFASAHTGQRYWIPHRWSCRWLLDTALLALGTKPKFSTRAFH